MSQQPYGAYQQLPTYPPQQQPRKGLPTWGWVLIVLGGLLVLSCAGCLGFLVYIGEHGPDTKVYTANEIPAKYLETMRSLDLLESDEKLKFFYSDALTDIQDGFSFVSDRKVLVYSKDAATPATHVPFTRIRDVAMTKGSGMFEDSDLTLILDDDSVVSFPLSVEQNRDDLVLDAIRKSIPAK